MIVDDDLRGGPFQDGLSVLYGPLEVSLPEEVTKEVSGRAIEDKHIRGLPYDPGGISLDDRTLKVRRIEEFFAPALDQEGHHPAHPIVFPAMKEGLGEADDSLSLLESSSVSEPDRHIPYFPFLDPFAFSPEGDQVLHPLFVLLPPGGPGAEVRLEGLRGAEEVPKIGSRDLRELLNEDPRPVPLGSVYEAVGILYPELLPPIEFGGLKGMGVVIVVIVGDKNGICLLYTSPSPRD